MSMSTTQKRDRQAKAQAEIMKVGGSHGLRHAYATHQLEQGLPVHQLQHQLGHKQLQTTLCYVHWVASYHQGSGAFSDLVGQLAVTHG